MTPEQQALRAAFLAELWPVCRELPREERAVIAARATSSTPVEKARRSA